MNWENSIANCVQEEDKRVYLKALPLTLISSAEFIPDTWYWIDWIKSNIN